MDQEKKSSMKNGITSPNPRREVFDRLAGAWDQLPKPPDLESILRQVAAAGEIRPGGRILDIGTGTGGLLPYLLEQGAGEIVAVDLSTEMLARACQKGGRMIMPLCADAECLPLWTESFDIVFCHGVYPHFSRPDLVLQNLWRVLRPGGRLVISLPGGRDRINAIHAAHSDPALQHDRMPPAVELSAYLKKTGWQLVSALDETSFYLIVGQKRGLTP